MDLAEDRGQIQLAYRFTRLSYRFAGMRLFRWHENERVCIGLLEFYDSPASLLHKKKTTYAESALSNSELQMLITTLKEPAG